MNRKIITSLVSSGIMLSLVVGATFAYFSDTNSSSANMFTAGNLNLQLDDVNEQATSSPIAASFGGAAMAPGSSTTGFVSLHNSGTINMAEILMGATQTATIDNGDGSNLSDVLNLTVLTGSDSTCTTDSVDHTDTMATEVGNGSSPLTLAELVAADYDALPGIAASGTYYMCMTAAMETTAGNQYQGDSVTVDFHFTANQNVSQ